MHPLPTAADAADTPEEASRSAEDDDAYRSLIARLSRQSVDRHFDAYADVDWDAPDHRIDPADTRWIGVLGDTLVETEWFAGLPPAAQARLGLHLVVSRMKLGLQFENVLQRGLLEYALGLGNGDPEFRYAYHEVIEEGHHTLMFQEFVNRSGIDATGLGPVELVCTRAVVRSARRFPELFFFFVLAGEDPIDHVQRRSLRSGQDVPPLLQRIMRIHVTEEARHLSFARNHLKRAVPALGPVRRLGLSLAVPVVLWLMSQMMLGVPWQVSRRFRIPRAALAQARRAARDRAEAAEAVRKVRQLASELGLLGPLPSALWRGLGLVEPARAPQAPGTTA